jgi:effector-binding domain-containing protein
VIPAYNKIMTLYDELIDYLAPYDLRQWRALTIWHDEGYREQDVDAEACITLKALVPGTATIRAYELTGCIIASTVHNGGFNKIYLAYNAINAWIEANGYRVNGPNRELYHYAQEPLRDDDNTYVTEIQFPVEKA